MSIYLTYNRPREKGVPWEEDMTEPEGQDDAAPLVAALERAFARRHGTAPRLSPLTRLSGGASKENWAFSAMSDGVERALVLRAAPAESRFEAAGVIGLSTEAALLRLAYAHGVPVPEVVCELVDADRPGYAMQHVAGQSVGVRILKDEALAEARAAMARQCGEILARIHAIPVGGLPALDALMPGDAVAALADAYRATGQQRPVFELALCWLIDRLPDCGAPVLVHGDFRNGNLIVGPEGVRAVLDWETAHIGCAAEDLGWLCVPSWRFQRPELPVGGFGTCQALLDGYHAAGGRPTSMDDLRFWQMFGSLRWGVMCAGVGARFAGGVRSVEGGMIARRASETEYDLLALMRETGDA